MRNVAVVSSSMAGERRSGLGLVVGWQQGETWLAVPAHVIYQGKRSAEWDSHPPLVGVMFAESRSAPLCARPEAGESIKAPAPDNLDIAFVCVQTDPRWFFQESLVARELRIGTSLRLGGEPGLVALSDTSVEVVRVLPAGQYDHGADVFVKGTGKDGQSGAIAMGPAGVVGLYLGGELQGRLFSLRAAREQAKAVDVPWRLVEHQYFDCTKNRRVCMSAEEPVAPGEVDLTSMPPKSVFRLRRGACEDVPEGKYALVAPGANYSCEPQSISVYSSAEPYPLRLDCLPQLAGSWRTPAGDLLVCGPEVEMGVAECVGLRDLGLGVLKATLTARSDHVSVRGDFVIPGPALRPAAGTFRWSLRKLVGQIRREGLPARSVELDRVEELP